MQNMKNFDSHIGSVLQAQMESLFADLSHIYVDIECLLDLRLTALLSMCDEEEYRKFRPLLLKYNNSKMKTRFNEVLGATRHSLKTIDAITRNPFDKVRYTYMLQGKNTLLRVIDILQSDLQFRNASTGKITIACGDKFIPEGIKTHIKNLLKINDGVVVEFVPTVFEEISISDIVEHAVFFIYDIEEAFKSERIQTLFGEGNFFGKIVFAHPIISITEAELREAFPKITDPDFFNQDKQIERAADVFRTLCDFNYLPMGLENV